MCGLVGVWQKNNQPQNLEAIAKNMSDALLHRGPDGQGYYVDSSNHLALAHRRLSVQDLSEHGSQPMASACQRYVLVFNGEIYNHKKIRNELDSQFNVVWRGQSDTETLLNSLMIRGVDKTLEVIEGMFAFALWDRQLKRLTLARDRFGEKPLYYGFLNHTWVFTSELKAIKRIPSFKVEINRQALEQLFTFNYIPAPLSIYQGILKLLPGSYVHIDEGMQSLDTVNIQQYWSLTDEAMKARRNPFLGSFTDAVESLDQTLSASVSAQMESDVPLGAFLSGGLDSSLITALMQKQSQVPINTFTIGFHDKEFNEAVQAKAIADVLKTNHTELYVEPESCLDFIQDLPKVYDEPFADSSQLPTLLLSKLVRDYVTVALSGDGGDELFAGYNRYRSMYILKRVLELPYGVRQCIATAGNALPVNMITSALQGLGFNQQNLAVKVQKILSAIAAKNNQQLYFKLLGRRDEASNIVLGSSHELLSFDGVDPSLDVEHLMMLMDSVHYLPNDILTKVDRASMAYSLEVRAPYLTREVFNLAWSLPLHYKLDKTNGKKVLRALLERYIPPRLLEMDKKGFAIPIDEWLRGPLREWAEALLDSKILKEQGYLDADKVQEEWQLHLTRKKNYGERLWAVLMFQAWLIQS